MLKEKLIVITYIREEKVHIILMPVLFGLKKTRKMTFQEKLQTSSPHEYRNNSPYQILMNQNYKYIHI